MRTSYLRLALILVVIGLVFTIAIGQEKKLNIIVFGAHPDDADGRAGGVAAKWSALGHKVQLVSVTNGDAGHQTEGGGALAQRRRLEAAECGRRLGAEYITLDNHDGELLPTLEVRQQVIRLIRKWNADVVIGPRPNDYHPDHRYTGVLLQDAAYMVTVPNVCPDTPSLRKNPVFLYSQDGFKKPALFSPDIAVAIDEVAEQKLRAADAHTSQMYEWLAWHAGTINTVPKDPAARLEWLRKSRGREDAIIPAVRASLEKWYGKEAAAKIKFAEAFELCEYGSRPNEQEIRRLFPFFPAK
jgi:LmbE family N-acetylglucosaminyl deacetylase